MKKSYFKIYPLIILLFTNLLFIKQVNLKPTSFKINTRLLNELLDILFFRDLL